MKHFVVTFGDGTKITVEANSPGAARASAQDQRWPGRGMPTEAELQPCLGLRSRWERAAIVDVKPMGD